MSATKRSISLESTLGGRTVTVQGSDTRPLFMIHGHENIRVNNLEEVKQLARNLNLLAQFLENDTP